MNLILGTANFGNDYGKRIEKDECFKILDRAKQLGVWALDTAVSYGDSSKIIAEWDGGLPMFSKHKWNEPRPEATWVLSHDILCRLKNPKLDGMSMYDPWLLWIYNNGAKKGQTWLQAPFNPLNIDFKEHAHQPYFIARSIFLGGKFYGESDRKAIARLTFGFLRSHEVKNVVFGVDSIEELEINVAAARDTRTYDARLA